MRIFTSSGYHGNIATHNLLWKVGLIESSVTQLALIIIAHGPQTAIALKKQAVRVSSRNCHDIASHNLLWFVGPVRRKSVRSAVAQLA